MTKWVVGKLPGEADRRKYTEVYSLYSNTNGGLKKEERALGAWIWKAKLDK